MKYTDAELAVIILSFIPTKKVNRINLSELVRLANVRARRIKRVITLLRKFYPICSLETDGGGYWIAESSQDIIEFLQMIERRINGYNQTLNTMRKHYNSFDGIEGAVGCMSINLKPIDVGIMNNV